MTTKQMRKPTVSETPETASAVSFQPTQAEKVLAQQQLEPSSYTQWVQISMRFTLSVILFCRELFPESAFRWRKDSGLHHTYHDCVQSDAVEDALNLSHRIPFLAKGREDTVDKFIAWLEQGAFEALGKDYLKALQLRVLEDPNHPGVLLESHTLHVVRKEGRESSLSLRALDHTAGREVTQAYPLSRGRDQLNTRLRELVMCCNSLETLPANTYLEMVLYYTEERPSTYHPPGFRENTNPACNVFPSDETWRTSSMTLNCIELPDRKVKLHTRHLELRDDVERSNERMLIPSGMPGVQEHESLEPIDGSDVQDQEASHTNQSLEVNAASEYDIPLDIEENLKDNCVNKRKPPNFSQSTTQLDRDAKDKEALTSFLNAPPLQASQIETQVAAYPVFEVDSIGNSANGLDVPESNLQFQYGPRTLERLSSIRKSRAEKDTVQCECKTAANDTQKFRCNFCRAYKHVVCYGFHGLDDPRRPKTTACYSCLLVNQDNELFSLMQRLAISRIAMVTLKSGERNLSDSLGIDKTTAKRITDTLCSEGLISESRRRISLDFLSNEKLHERLNSRYFNPTTHIEGYLAKPAEDPDTSSNATMSPSPPRHMPREHVQRDHTEASREPSLSCTRPNEVENQGTQTPNGSISSGTRAGKRAGNAGVRSSPRIAQKRMREAEMSEQADGSNPAKKARIASGMSIQTINTFARR